MYWMNTGTHVISTKTQTADISLIELQCMARVQDSEDLNHSIYSSWGGGRVEGKCIPFSNPEREISQRDNEDKMGRYPIDQYASCVDCTWSILR